MSALLHDLVSALARTGVPTSGQVHVVDGEPVGAVIARMCRHVEADLVGVGSHGRSGIAALTPVGTSHVVAAELTGPVLVTRVTPGQRSRPVRVMVAIDASPAAETALVDAIRVARPTGAAVRVVHVQEPAGVRPPLEFEAARDADLLVERGIETVRRHDLRADGEVVLAGGSVAEASRRFDADLAVVASRRPSDLQAFVVGSVAHELIRVLGRPVLLAHRAPMPS